MPNSAWYTKNRAEIIDLIPSVMSYMLHNDMLMNQYQDQTVQSVVDMAAALVAEVDQRGIAPTDYTAHIHRLEAQSDVIRSIRTREADQT